MFTLITLVTMFILSPNIYTVSNALYIYIYIYNALLTVYMLGDKINIVTSVIKVNIY